MSEPTNWKDRLRSSSRELLRNLRERASSASARVARRRGDGAPERQNGVTRSVLRPFGHRLRKLGPTSFEPGALLEWANTTFQKQNAAFYGKLITVLLCTYFLADVTSLFLERFVPEPPPVRTQSFGGPGGRNQARSLDQYSMIMSRNLFNEKGLIPGETETTPKATDLGGAPVRTTLPFELVGTVILKNELRSIGTIEDKTANMIYPVRAQDEIPSKAKILKVEPRRVIFVNLASGRREFVELPPDFSTNGPQLSVNSRSRSRGTPSKGAGVERVSPTQFNVSRSEVDKAMANLNQVLTQARAVPNFENGVPSGYKLFQIVPGSIYDKLGLQNGDTICGLNGQGINDPGKAFEMLNELRTSSNLELCVKRDGRQQTFAYDIH
jgi:general secretion pathway protein C